MRTMFEETREEAAMEHHTLTMLDIVKVSSFKDDLNDSTFGIATIQCCTRISQSRCTVVIGYLC